MYNQMCKYNGWTNKPTWIINNWILDNQSLLRHIESEAIDIIEHYEYETGQEQAQKCKYELADLMKDYFEDIVYNQRESMDNHHLFNFLNFAFAWVNWDELAESYLIDVNDNRKS